MIRGIAARQHGVVTRNQLVRNGLSPWEVRYRLETGRLERVHRGVYGVGPIPGERQREMAALLACGPGGLVSHWSAAACWELTTPRAGRSVAISVPRDVRIADPGIRVFRVDELHDDEATTLAGLRLTTPARTMLDLAAWATTQETERALAKAIPGLAEPDEIHRLLLRYPRKRGRRRLLEVLEGQASHGFTRSEAERAFLRVVRSGDLDLPETNVMVEGYEVDCLWRDDRLVVEIDGRAYHSSARSFQADRDRDTALTAAGYRVIRVTWSQIRNHPRRLLVRLAGALARR